MDNKWRTTYASIQVKRRDFLKAASVGVGAVAVASSFPQSQTATAASAFPTLAAPIPPAKCD
ncbi:twin-arginine translocation signal domain-containing protein [Dictyobacter alpinus]|uniref:twin-arginine translocation signal domain-containing protein n=1 Tax=Dictyobacter alpinus TaxID=2014873 RepID=UPI000F839042